MHVKCPWLFGRTWAPVSVFFWEWVYVWAAEASLEMNVLRAGSKITSLLPLSPLSGFTEPNCIKTTEAKVAKL